MYTLTSLNRLNEIHKDTDIKSLSSAIFPGTHCPLFGVALTASYIKNMVVVVIGTSECTYYTKNFAYHRQKGQDLVYSLSLDENEIVFGAQHQVEQAIRDIIEIEQPDALMLVTTCVPELIGEDYSFITHDLKDEVGIPLFVVHTDHFTCNSHILGMLRTLSALIHVMEATSVQSGINILGHRQEKVEETELFKLLDRHGVPINAIIPSKCTIDDIRKAPQAKLNIVTDMIALDLAKEMKRKFLVDYIYFDKHMNQAIIEENYRKLSAHLGVDLMGELLELKSEYDELFVTCQTLLRGKKLIYGNTPMMAFETVDFLSDLGLEPVFVQVRELYEQDERFKQSLLDKGYNPYVCRIANIAPLRELYDEIGADLYVGHENPMLLKQKGLQQITFDRNAQKIGYELPIGVMKDLIHLYQVETNKEGNNHASL
ncbi:MAG: nitrogenase component 1 [Turicibacter sp.]